MADSNDDDSSVGTGGRGALSSPDTVPGSVARVVQPLAPPCGAFDDDDEIVGKETTIRFRPGAELVTFHDGADIDELAQNRQLVWYQYDELKAIKRKALQISKEAQRHGLGVMLTNTYGKKCEETQEALNTWARNGNSRRGLERWINDEYAAKRSDIRKRTIQSVVRAQAKMKDSELNDPDYSTKVLSRLSEAFSIDSKQFARGMGLADEIAATHGGKDSSDVDDSKSVSDSVTDDRKGSLRKGSPRSVMAISASKAKKLGVGRNLGLTSPSVSADFRHYF